jgi:uncharacterized repeat protein (TIGR03803 family)
MGKSERLFAIVAAVMVAFGVCRGAEAPSYATVYQFTGYLGGPDGSYPIAPVVVGPGGVLYGTTQLGGAVNSTTCPQGCGTVFSLTPPAERGLPWTETILYSFTGGSDGYWPSAALTLGADAVLYGTAVGGGASGYGTAFSLSPPPDSGVPWAEHVLYSFPGPVGPGGEGSGSCASLLMSKGGLLYGTEAFGGAYGGGAAFLLTPSSSPGDWTETLLYSFGAEGDGSDILSGLTVSGGILYGTTALGGASNNGTVFSLTPPGTAGGDWTEAVLYSFAGGTDGVNPNYGNLVVGAGGVLYGTTLNGGEYGKGTVFSLTPPASQGAAWSESVLLSFSYRSGESPDGGLAIDKAGNLYGTTSAGGNSTKGLGTVFQLAPPAEAGGPWKFTDLHTFTNSTNGIVPMSGVTIDAENKVIYGTASGFYYIPQNGGTVYSLTF